LGFAALSANLQERARAASFVVEGRWVRLIPKKLVPGEVQQPWKPVGLRCAQRQPTRRRV